jgi:iron uptake system component EfeO
VWIGVSAAVAICLALGVALQLISQDLPQRQQEGLETVIGLVAVGMVTYMVVWMRRHSRDLKCDLEHAASDALANGSATALVVMAFLAVLREGFETAVFLLATFQHSTRPLLGGIGALLGVLTALGLGVLIYRGGLHLNLSRFFRVTGLVLVVIAAGLLMASAHTAHEAGWLDAGQAQVADLSWLVRPGTPVSSLFTGVLGIQPQPTVSEAVVWFAYLVPLAVYVAWPQRRRSGASRGTAAELASTAVIATLLLVLVAGCASSDGEETGAASGATQVAVTLTSSGCKPTPAKVASGPVHFAITNADAGSVTEAELLDSSGKKILGEKENLTPGLSGGFTLTLAAGTYVMRCPGAGTPSSTFTVTKGQQVTDWHGDPTLVAAVKGYDRYVRTQVAHLVTASNAFAAAVKAGDIDRAEQLYGPARTAYERIEPVAESFGDLDPLLDGRADDAATPADFTGFHRLEKALWVDHDLAGTAPVADQLVRDVGKLSKLVATSTYSPAEMSRGAGELIDEIQASKVTGEEERYSHLDLVDFVGNLDGSMETIDLLRPELQKVAPDLLTQIDRSAAAVRGALHAYEATPGVAGSGYVDYRTVTPAQRRALSQLVNALGASISQVPVKVTS